MMLVRAARLMLAILVLTFPLAPAVQADQDIVPAKVTTKLALPLDTTYHDANTNEDVHVTGTLLVKQVINYQPNNPIKGYPGNPCKISDSYKLGTDVVAVGMTSGNPYIVKGKGTLKYAWPPNPWKSLDQHGVLVGIPNNPCTPNNPCVPNDPIRIHYHVDYDPQTGLSTGSTIDFPSNPVAPGACVAIAQVCTPP